MGQRLSTRATLFLAWGNSHTDAGIARLHTLLAEPWVAFSPQCVTLLLLPLSRVAAAARVMPAPGQRGIPLVLPWRWLVRGLGPCADFVPAIANSVFEALPGARMPGLPVATRLGFQRGPVPAPVALVRA